MRRDLFVLFFALLVGTVSCKDDDGPAPDKEEEIPPVEYKAEPFGVNLAGAEFGTEFPGKYGTDYTYPTTAELDYFKSKGLMLVRLPFKWERIQHELNGELDPVELGRMKNFVNAAEERGIQILLDMHNYGRRKYKGTSYIIGHNAITIDHLADAWVKLAQEFKSNTNIWGYGIMNEPHDMPTPTSWFNIAQGVIKAIRTVDTKTTIVVGGESFSSAAKTTL